MSESQEKGLLSQLGGLKGDSQRGPVTCPARQCEPQPPNPAPHPHLTNPDQPRQHIKKQRHCFANKGPSSPSYDFPVVMYGCES